MKQTSKTYRSKTLLLVLTALLVSACQDQSTTKIDPISIEVPAAVSFETLEAEIQTLIAEEKYETAILKSNKLLKEHDNNIKGYFLLADLYKRLHNPEKLTALVNAMAAKFPKEAGVLLWQVRAAIQTESFQGALDLINPFFKADNTDDLEKEVLYYYGLLKILQNDLVGGKEVMVNLKKESDLDASIRKNALEIENIYDEFDEFADGKNAHFFALIAKKLTDNNEIVLAKKFAENAAKEDANYIDAWILSGFTKLKLKQFDEALIDLNLAYDQDPLRPETHFFLAETLQNLGRATEAALYYEKALENGFEFTDSVTRQLIDIFSRQNKFEKTLELYEKLLKTKDAKVDEFVSAVNLVLNKQKNPAKALELAEKVNKKFPKDLVALNLLAWAETENNDLEDAQETLDYAFKIDKENARTLLNQGFLDEKNGEMNNAVEWFQKSYQRGKETGEVGITNLAADKYNELIQKIKTTSSADLERPTSAP